MFKKIIDKPPCSIQIQFLQSFGLDCLSKIKNIEVKFNQVEWESEKYSFEPIAFKVKTMLECYQIIAHQIYDSFQSVQLESLGHAIVKMYLQIASAIKWLIKSFSISYHRDAKYPETHTQIRSQQNQSEKFRKREISRFILKGVMKNRDSECRQEEQNFDSIEGIFSQNKETLRNSKNKILSVHSSNLPLLLEDTVEYLNKKSEYIDKFIALRENYEGLNRHQAPMTSQAILQSEHEVRKNESSKRLRNIFNKIMTFQESKKPKTSDKNIQVSINQEVSEKFKKAVQKNKIKQMSQEIEHEKNMNKQLKLRLELYESQLDSREDECEIINKKLNFGVLRKKSSRFEQHSQKRSSDSKYIKDEDFQEDPGNIPMEEDKKSEFEGEYFRNTRLVRKRNSKITNRAFSVKEVDVNTSVGNKTAAQILKNTPHLLVIESKVHTMSIQSKKNQFLQFCSCVFNLEFLFSNEISQDLSPSNQKLLQIEQVDLLKRDFTDGKRTQFTSDKKMGCMSSPISIDQKFSEELKPLINKQVIGSFQDKSNYQRQNNKTPTFSRNFKKNSLENIFMKSNLKETEQRNMKQKFENTYAQFQIKNPQISIFTLCQFFIDEQIAKNYEILSLSSICQWNKKIKSRQVRNRKVESEVHGTSASKKQNQCQKIETESALFNVLTIFIYQQINRLRKGRKPAYLKILLFLRYPHSSFCRSQELVKKYDENEQKQFCLVELQEHFKRIRTIHSRCETHKAQIQEVGWCQHMQFILAFFGFRKIDKVSENVPEQMIL